MKFIKLLFAILFTSSLITSCTSEYLDQNRIPLEEVVSRYDLWYVDTQNNSYNNDNSFLSRAFTVSFLNGTMYANNNISGIGNTGGGLGIVVGRYDTYKGFLETFHNQDGKYDFDVVVISNNEIRVEDQDLGISYLLVGYQRNNFDYDKLYYDNIEYLLEEYNVWERTGALGGVPKAFEEETYLKFDINNPGTFYSSNNNSQWDFAGSYEVFNYSDVDNVKELILTYSNGDVERFELTIINDTEISLYHFASKTTYTYSALGFIQLQKGAAAKSAKPKGLNNNRKRDFIKRKTIERKIKV